MKRLIILAILVVGLVQFLPNQSELNQPKKVYAANVITVTTTADEINNDGDCSLREAIQSANQNISQDECAFGSSVQTDQIVLANGATYNVTNGNPSNVVENFNQTGDLDLWDDPTTVGVDIDIIVSGGGTATITGAGSFSGSDRLFHLVDMDTSNTTTPVVTMTGVIIRNAGYTTGGCIYIEGTLTLTSSNVEACIASNGGGIYNTTASVLTIQGNSVIGGSGNSNSTTSADGGGIHNRGTLNIINSTVSYNVSNDEGGGIYNFGGSTLNITGSTIGNNTAKRSGGGIYATNTTSTISSSVITGNSIGPAHANNTSGGGIYLSTGSIALTGTTVSSNTSTIAGGGLYATNTGVTIQGGSLFTSNVSLNGGGIYNTIGSMNIDASGATLNTANNSGGGVYNAGILTIENNSYVNTNNAISSGGGIYNALTLTLNNSQVSENTSQNGAGLFTNSILVDPATVLVQNNTLFQNNIASFNGGAIYNVFSDTDISGSRILSNTASNTGSAVYNDRNAVDAVTINQSCIVNNTDVAVLTVHAQIQTATFNWWGTNNGAGPMGPGAGDTVSNYIDWHNPLTSAILACPNKTVPNITLTPTPTNTFTPTHTPTNTFTPSNTPTPTDTPTNTFTPSDTPPVTDTFTPTDTPPVTDTFTPTASNTTCAISVTAPSLTSPVHRAHTANRTPTFRWSEVTGAQSYRLMVYTEDRSFEYKKRLVGQTKINYTLTIAEALAVNKYLWRVRTQDQTCSTWSLWSTRNTLFID